VTASAPDGTEDFIFAKFFAELTTRGCCRDINYRERTNLRVNMHFIKEFESSGLVTSVTQTRFWQEFVTLINHAASAFSCHVPLAKGKSFDKIRN